MDTSIWGFKMISVRNFMTMDVITISKDTSIMEAAKFIISKSVSGLVVVEKKKPIGIISENDIVIGILLRKKKVSDVMTNDFRIISPLQSLHNVTRLLNKQKIKRFIVAENEKLVGLITETDIIEATRDLTRFHQILLELILAIFGLSTAFFLFYFSPLGRSIFGY